jgi:SagB-type dehydrogenase family enzyme
MSVAHDYLTAIVRRAREEMEPKGFVIDWADKPRQAKFYPDADGFALPAAPVGRDRDPDPIVAASRRPVAGRALTLPKLGDLLFHSYARLGRRLGINANGDLTNLPSYPTAKWARGTASGGGVHPVSVYWVTGRRGAAVPGLYHYYPFQHAMRRLLAGDVTAEVAAALGERRVADQYLVLGIKFWQNAFKYSSFSYHATGFDVGTILQTWRMLASGHGVDVVPSLWFDEPRLGRLLNVRPEHEGVFAVVALSDPGDGAPRPGPAAARSSPPPRVRYTDLERSHQVLTFDTVSRMHGATLAGCARRPDPNAVKAAAVLPRLDREPVALPAPAELDTGLRRALRARQSSFGRFESTRPTSGALLSAVLAGIAAAVRFRCDVLPPDADVHLVKQYVFVNHVTGVDPGVYEYDPAAGRLHRITPGPRGAFLQRYYTLTNYNVEQAGAVIVPAVRVPALLSALGDRGYRLATAITGAAAQACYTLSAAAGLGCGVALGLDAVAYREELQLEDSDEVPLLIMMIGHERPRVAAYRYDLV